MVRELGCVRSQALVKKVGANEEFTHKKLSAHLRNFPCSNWASKEGGIGA